MLRLRKKEGPVMVRELDADLLLLDVDSDRIHQLNRTARFIWQRCDGKQTAEEIADLLATEFAVESRVALKDVIETLGKLQALNLLVDA
jgi:hypothetical protein